MPDARRIALLGPAYPYRGGIAHFLNHLDAGLRERGHTTRMFTFTRQYPERLFPGKTQFEEGAPPGASAAPAATAASPELPHRVLDTMNPLSWSRTAAAIRRFQPDSLVLKYWMPWFAPSFGSVVRSLRRAGIPSTIIVDNAIPHERRSGDVLLGRYVLRAAAQLVVMSDSVRADLEDRIGVDASIHQIVHPIYDNFGSPIPRADARAALGIAADAKLILFFGFIRPYKGLHVLLDAMPDVLARLPEPGGAQLLIAGECYGDPEPYRAAIERAERSRKPGATSGAITGAIRWDDDYIPDEKVALYFCAADVVVQPYISATQSGVAQIAYNFERPMIVTDVGGLPEVVARDDPRGAAGLVVPPLDASALADAIVHYFEQNLSENLAPRVREEKTRFTWDPLYEALERGQLERGQVEIRASGSAKTAVAPQNRRSARAVTHESRPDPVHLLCGGFGTRLRPVVDDRPKVLAPVGGPGGRPLLDLQLRRLADAGVQRVVLSAGYLADQIVEFVGDGSRWGIDATVIVEETPLGTGGALALAVRTLALTGPFLALNADSLTTVPIDELWLAHAAANPRAANSLATNPLATIAVVKTDDPSRFGTVSFDAHDADALALVTGFREKSAAPSEHPQQTASWINAGVYVVEAHALADVPPGEAVSLERDLFPSWLGRMFAFAAPGASLLDIGTPDDYARALEWINKQGWTAD